MNSPQPASGAAETSEHALMGLALDEARRAAAAGDVPVGAVLVSGSGEVLAVAHNRREVDGDPTAHAEILALRAAGVGRARWRLDDCTLVVTLEPCTMCAGAIVLARVARVVLGAWDEKAGACGSTRDVVRDSRLNHRAEVTGGVRAEECAALLTEFFAARRDRGDEAPRPSR
ncbi:tRNA adenosine(34) deaminase TadA [Occultella aeris]|uniref:tRNA-specific adenosine deaminase n=1 Tax=Occultella aeris TaxID=2761496 RepID=A0A7M4DK54_9MICO|nr:tRNA adenosine(34) deaminase TadA [Occultella aeris]VZO37445.1 tRNA-specific adenosine deaminase [Occultella aeris]